MISFSIDKQRGQVNVEWMSRPVDSTKKIKNNQPLVLVLTSMEQSPIFASRLKRNFCVALFSGELTFASIFRGAHWKFVVWFS
jgi:hypothetical protein